MLRKESEVVFKGNGPVHQEGEYGFGQPAPVDDFREIRSLLKEQEKMLKERRDDLKDGMRRLIEQYAARLEQDARQPRLAMEADGSADTKTHESSNGWGGLGYDGCLPGEVTKTTPSGDRTT